MLENDLRELFLARVQRAPLVDDAASGAIARGRAARRRRVAASSTAAVVLLVISLVGFAAAQENGSSSGRPVVAHPEVSAEATNLSTTPGRPSQGPARATGVGLDIRAGDQLWTTEGQRLALTGVGAVSRAYRVPTGWVYGGADTVRLLRRNGTSVGLSGQDDRWVLSPGGDRIAFALDAMLHIGAVTDAGLALRVSVDIGAQIDPVAFVGERVALRGPAGYAVLDPDRVTAPVWNNEVLAVFGARPNGMLAALVRDRRTATGCLAELEVRGRKLHLTRKGDCGVPLTEAAGEDRLSGDGTWLVEVTAEGLRLVDVGQTLAGKAATVGCAVPTVVPPVWSNGGAVLTADANGLVRCQTDGSWEAIPLPVGVAGDWRLVPRLEGRTKAPGQQ